MASSSEITYYSRCRSGCSSCSGNTTASPDSDLEDSAASPLRRNGGSDCNDNDDPEPDPDPDPNPPLRPATEDSVPAMETSHNRVLHCFRPLAVAFLALLQLLIPSIKRFNSNQHADLIPNLGDQPAPFTKVNVPSSPKHGQQTRCNQRKSHDFPINVFAVRNGRELPTPTPSIEENVHMHRVRRLHSFPIYVYSIHDIEELPTPTPSIEDDQYYNGVDQMEEGDEYESLQHHPQEKFLLKENFF